MSVDRTLRVVLAGVMAVVALTSCQRGRGSDESDGQAAERDGSLVFLESNYAPAEFEGGDKTQGGAIAVRLASTVDYPIEITSIAPVAEAGLNATYVGYSDCTTGCPFAVHWDDRASRLLQGAKQGTVPLKLRPRQQDVTLLFRLEVDGGTDQLVSKCVLRIVAARMRIAGRSGLIDVTAPDGTDIGGLQVGVERPPQAKDCKSATE